MFQRIHGQLYYTVWEMVNKQLQKVVDGKTASVKSMDNGFPYFSLCGDWV
jgi:hypothetical protein